MPVSGRLIIGSDHVATAEQLESGGQFFSCAGAEEVEKACSLADAAFDPYRNLPMSIRADFLDRCADHLMDLGESLLDGAEAETGLSRVRLEGERSRTVGQLHLFAGLVRQGDFQSIRIEPAQPDRKPAPRPDLRLRKIPVGPVAVFGASNFPLAFSAAGGDTVSALAAGCPVVVKAHPSHPATSERAATAIRDAAEKCRLPNGVFSHLAGPSNDLGARLVADPRIKSVAFTGSRAGGLALLKIASSRSEPIPVFAEMSSINPILVFPAALAARWQSLAAGFVASLTLGAGQFCTNPGLVLGISGPDFNHFAETAAALLESLSLHRMLSPSIQANYSAGVARLVANGRVTRLAGDSHTKASLFQVSAADVLNDASLTLEVFGPSALLVKCRDLTQMQQVIQSLDGQLTATLQLDAADQSDASAFIALLERKAGRLLVNGWPTGVEVSPAMVHGGPFPATSDPRTTSVGSLAIDRFLRPVCYQDFPNALLPSVELREEMQ